MVRLMTFIALIWVIILSGCAGVPAYADPGLPGDTRDFFPCAYFVPGIPTYVTREAHYDNSVGAWTTRLITGVGPAIGGVVQTVSGWSWDSAGLIGYTVVNGLTTTVEFWQNGAVIPYKLSGAWGFVAGDASQVWDYIDVESKDNYIWAVGHEQIGANMYPMYYTTLLGWRVYPGILDPTGFTDYFSMTLDPGLFGMVHVVFHNVATGAIEYSYYNPSWFQQGVFNATNETTAVGIAFSRPMILTDFSNHLSVFGGLPTTMVTWEKHNDNPGVWAGWPNPMGPIAVYPNEASWHCARRATDDTLHFVWVDAVINFPNVDYTVYYNRWTVNGWFEAPPVAATVGIWSVPIGEEADQDARLMIQISTAPSGIVIWVVEWDTVLGIGDLVNYYLSPANYHDSQNPAAWVTANDVDSSLDDIYAIDAPEFLRW